VLREGGKVIHPITYVEQTLDNSRFEIDKLVQRKMIVGYYEY